MGGLEPSMLGEGGRCQGHKKAASTDTLHTQCLLPPSGPNRTYPLTNLLTNSPRWNSPTVSSR